MDSSDFLGDGNGPRVVGHRGNPARFPDNSLAGISSGLDLVGSVEIDIRLSADGRLVLSHDPEWDGRSIVESDFGELEGLVLLDEVMALGGCLDLEVKNLPGEPGFDPDGLLARQVAVRAGPCDIVTSFYWPDMDLIRARAPGVATGLLAGKHASPAETIAHAAEAGHLTVGLHVSSIDRETVDLADRAGTRVMAWTVNDLRTVEKLSEWGIAAIISDDPLAISRCLMRSGGR